MFGNQIENSLNISWPIFGGEEDTIILCVSAIYLGITQPMVIIFLVQCMGCNIGKEECVAECG